MTSERNDHKVFVDENGRKYIATDLIGKGGQGAVWKVAGDNRVVIKTEMQTEINPETNEILEKVVEDESRYEEYSNKIKSLMALSILENIKNVSVPISILQKPVCGYVMRFMEDLEPISAQFPGPQNIETQISMTKSNSSIKKKYYVLMNLALNMMRLHNKGIIYCDFSPNNVFISKNPKDHEAWLIEPDNLVYVGKNRSCINTPNYGAPEVCNGRKNTFYSDVFSFAIIAFKYLTGTSPFNTEEKKNIELSNSSFCDIEDVINENGVSFESYKYIYAEENSSNGSGIPANFVFTKEIFELFNKTFSANGISYPNYRPIAERWYNAFLNGINEITRCSNEHEHFGPECMWCNLEKRYDNNRYFKLKVERFPESNNYLCDNWETENIDYTFQCYECNALFFSQLIIPVEKQNKKFKKIANVDLEIPGAFFNDEKSVAKIEIKEKAIVSLLVEGEKTTWNYLIEKHKIVDIIKNNIPYRISVSWENSI